MQITDLIVDSLSRTAFLLKSALADFTDSEMFVRPLPGANHPAWQVGHLVVAESNMINAVAPGKGGSVPPQFFDAFSKERANQDEPTSFPTKAEILSAFDTVRAASIAWARTLSPTDLDTSGPEKMLAFIPTVGALVGILSEHTALHVGQIQVVRRKLGKPHLM